MCSQKQALCAQIIKTQQMMAMTQGQVSPGQMTQQSAQQNSPGQPSPQAIYGYIQAMTGGCPLNALATLPRNAAGNIHYHPGMLLRPMDQKLSNSQEFPNPSEIRRRDGLNAYPHIYHEPPQPGKIPVPPASLTSSRDNNPDELEQFVQQEQNRTSRIRQRYGVNDDEDDPSFGFIHRPAVRGIRTETPPSGNSTSDANVLLLQQQQHQQMYLQRLQLLQLQQQMMQQHQNKNQASPGQQQQAMIMQSGQQQQPSPNSQQGPQGQNASQQHPMPPNRHVYLVHGVPQSQHLVSAAGATLPRNTQLRTLSTLTPQQTQQLQQHLQRQQQLQQQQQHMMQQQANGVRQPNPGQPADRPASSLGQSSEGSSTIQASQCTQCLLQRQQAAQVLHQQQLNQQQLRQPHPQPQVGQHLHTTGRPGSLHNPNLVQLANNNNNNSLLTYKTISMPNVAMIRPIGPLSVITGNMPTGVPGINANPDMNSSPRHPSSNESNSPSTHLTAQQQPRVSKSASSALSVMARNEQIQHQNALHVNTLNQHHPASHPSPLSNGSHLNNNNNNPDLVKDVTLRAKGLSSCPASSSDTGSSTSSCQHHSHNSSSAASSSNRSSLSMHSHSSPGSSKGSSTSSGPSSSLSAIASAAGFLKSSKNKTSDKDSKSPSLTKEDKKANKKESKKSDKKDKKEKTTTKEGVIYYSMNV